MKCPNCGREIADDSNYCEYCGTKVRGVLNKKALWITLGVLAAVCIVFGVWKLVPEHQEEQVIEQVAEPVEAQEEPTDKPVNVSTSHDDFTETVNGVDFKMVWVEGGTFTMGCTSEQGSDCYSTEKPAHSVTLSAYYIGETEVTQGLWRAVMGDNPSSSYFKKGNNYSVDMVSWQDAMEFCSRLSELTDRKYTLPTEAQWEYAARGGNKSRGYKFSGSDNINNVAWYGDNSGLTTHPVKSKEPNELGLYDMSGNVWEWCKDWDGSYSSNPQTNPTGPSSGSYRVLRGGCWIDRAELCHVVRRSRSTPTHRVGGIGFRVVLLQ